MRRLFTSTQANMNTELSTNYAKLEAPGVFLYWFSLTLSFGEFELAS